MNGKIIKENSFPFKFILKKIITGKIKIVIVIKLNANKPTLFKICKISVAQEKLQAHKFHGKPERIFDLKKSEKLRPAENSNIEAKLKFKNGPIIKIKIEKNKLKNNGIKIKPNGIKALKLSSNVNEFVIQ